MFIPFGFGSVGFGLDSDGFGPEIGFGIGGAVVPDRIIDCRITQQPNRHQRQGKSRKGRTLYGAQPQSQPQGQQKPTSNDFNISNLFG